MHPFYLGNPEIGLATEAAWCAKDQAMFFEYQHALYQNQGQMPYTQSALVSLAGAVGLDTNAFEQCLSSGTHRADVERARRAAANQGVNSTPTFFINGQRVEGNQPYSVFQRVIEQELANAQ